MIKEFYLSGEADSDAEKNPANDRHSHVLSDGIYDSTAGEDRATQQHGPPPTQAPHHLERTK